MKSNKAVVLLVGFFVVILIAGLLGSGVWKTYAGSSTTEKSVKAAAAAAVAKEKAGAKEATEEVEAAAAPQATVQDARPTLISVAVMLLACVFVTTYKRRRI